MTKLKLIITLLLFGFISMSAQSDETKEKLKNLEGEATKITIETSDGEIEITGEDAETLLKRMKAKKNIIIKELHHGDMDGAHKMVHKGYFYEESTRVPFIVAGPGVKQGVDREHLISSSVDLIPTFCDFAGAPPNSSLAGLRSRSSTSFFNCSANSA